MGASSLERDADAIELDVGSPEQRPQLHLRTTEVQSSPDLRERLLRRKPIARDAVGPMDLELTVNEQQASRDAFQPPQGERTRVRIGDPIRLYAHSSPECHLEHSPLRRRR